MTAEAAARPDEEHRAMYRRSLATPDPAMEPVNRTLDTNLNAFVLERLEGLHTPGHHVGPNDLAPGRLRSDLDQQSMASMDRLLDRRIETVADRIRRGKAA
ncbi:hypothetical protein OG948_57900 (plasmid) [Embleya sp. NBC_00888]|uniref:hypothetical protein n=1 Tax=Embleya sp. NBC_00888 TaxID=2975960 RepID=UPI002F90EC2B|nr:hypothetical protein OG948_57900 [Embleya sp. NBC_00888]